MNKYSFYVIFSLTKRLGNLQYQPSCSFAQDIILSKGRWMTRHLMKMYSQQK